MLKADELLYLSMLWGAEEVYGIPDVFRGKTDDEIKNLVNEATRNCEDKGLLIADFEGKQHLNERLDATIRLIASSEKITELILRNTKARQQRYLIYYKGKERVILYESGGEYFITKESEFSRVHNGLDILFAHGCLLKPETTKFTITRDEIDDAEHETKSETKPKASVIRGLMRSKGVDEITALLVTEGIAGRAGYFSAVTLDHLNSDTKTAMFIADSGIVFQITTDEKRNVNYSSVENEAAKQTALSFVGGGFYV